MQRIHNRGDIDIDFPNRDRALEGMNYVNASIIKDGKITKHNTGVYFHDVPQDPVTELCSVDYEAAEAKGFFKLDFLNVGVYEQVRDEAHLLELMHKPIDWGVFCIPGFVSELFHLGNYGELTARLKPQSIEHIAMILAMIRPGKKHLQKKCERYGFDSIRDEIWSKGDAGYEFKKSHGTSYAVLVYVHANLLLDQLKESAIVAG